MTLATPQEIRELVEYDPKAGLLSWKSREVSRFRATSRTAEHIAKLWNDRYAGTPAFSTPNGSGYLVGRLNGRNYYAHRVAWAIVHCVWPSDQIDHIDGNRAFNGIENLRDVPEADNHRNLGRARRNSSGITGVYWNKEIRKWVANIVVGSKTRYLGCFADKADAAVAFEAAKQTFGYHANHGFARKAA